MSRRDRVTGRYAFDGGFDCMSADRGVDGADGVPCGCMECRPATGKRASARKD